MLSADLHVHTRYSHAKGEPEEIVRAAISAGLERVAISEHGPKHMFFPVKWQKLLELRRDIDRLQDKYGNLILVQMGLEANLLGDGVSDVPKDDSIFDFVLLGYHKGTMPVDKLSRRWALSLFKKSSDKIALETAEAYARAMDKTKKLLAITHPGTYISVDMSRLAKEAASRGILLEINESHKNFTLDSLRLASCQGCRFLISSDAHHPQDVGKCDKSIALAGEAGILERVMNL